MKFVLISLALCCISVLADITSDKSLRESLRAVRIHDDGQEQLDQLTTIAQDTARARGYTFAPQVNKQAVMDSAFSLKNAQLIADLQLQQDFSYYIWPILCQTEDWSYMLSNNSPERNTYSFLWVLDKKPEPHTEDDYNNAIITTYRMYAAQKAAARKEALEDVIMVENWPPDGSCTPLYLITATVFIPGPTAGTDTVPNADGYYTLEITNVPTSTTVAGPIAGTTTVANPDGGFRVEITGVVVSTNVVPGDIPGTEILINDEGDYYEQITHTPISTYVVPGSVPGSETLINDGDYYVQVTHVPVSTNVVPGPVPGMETLINSDGDYYEQLTRTPVLTHIVPGSFPGTETLINDEGDYYEQITYTPVFTNIVPGPVPGTETLINADGDYYEQITHTPVSTHVAIGSFSGTETLINDEGDYYEQVTTVRYSSSVYISSSSSTMTETGSSSASPVDASSSSSVDSSSSSSIDASSSTYFWTEPISSSSSSIDISSHFSSSVEDGSMGIFSTDYSSPVSSSIGDSFSTEASSPFCFFAYTSPPASSPSDLSSSDIFSTDSSSHIPLSVYSVSLEASTISATGSSSFISSYEAPTSHVIASTKVDVLRPTDTGGCFCEQVTQTVISIKTVTVIRPVTVFHSVTETLPLSNGDYFEQVSNAPAFSSVSPPVEPLFSTVSVIGTAASFSFVPHTTNGIVFTNVVPGSIAGTQTLTNSDHKQVTRPSIFTKTVTAPVAGSKFLIDTNSAFYLQVTATTEAIVSGSTSIIATVAVLIAYGKTVENSTYGDPKSDPEGLIVLGGTFTVYVSVHPHIIFELSGSHESSSFGDKPQSVAGSGMMIPSLDISFGTGSQSDAVFLGHSNPAGSAGTAGFDESVSLLKPSPFASLIGTGSVNDPPSPNQAGVVETVQPQSPQYSAGGKPAQANDAYKLAIGLAPGLPVALILL